MLPLAEWSPQLPHFLLIAGAGAIAISRTLPVLCLISGFFKACTTKRGVSRLYASIKLASLCTGVILYEVPSRSAEDVRRFVLEDEHRRVETVLVGGSIALAAWTQLFVSSQNPPTNRLSAITLSLLFVGASVLLIVPILFRSTGRLATTLYRQLATYVGFGAVLLSLCGITVDLLDGWYEYAALTVAALLIGRDLAETGREITGFRRFANFGAAISILGRRIEIVESPSNP